MPDLERPNGCLHYRVDGPGEAPLLILAHALGASLAQWELQVAAFASHFRLLRYDSRGHGASSVSPGPYSIAELGRDVLALADALHVRRFAFCGLSMGGLVGQWLGLHAGDRLQQLVLCSTAPMIGTLPGWDERIAAIEAGGATAMQAMRDGAAERWFTPGFRAAEPAITTRILDQVAATAPAGYAASCAAIRDADFRSMLSGIHVPTLVACGVHDGVTTCKEAGTMQAVMPHAELATFEAAHLVNVEAAEAFNARVLAFLQAAGIQQKD